MDALAFEPQFLDHLAPVWRSLPPLARGRFLVDAPLLDRAREKGIDAETVDANAIRSSMSQQPPRFDGPPALVASIGDIKVGRRLGYGPFAFLEHGAGQTYSGGSNHGSYSGGPDRADNELVMVPSETCAAVWREAYPNVRAVVVGCPKLDTLPARESGPGPVVALSWHWTPSTSIGWGYAGTAWPEYRDALPALMERYAVIGHQHPNWLQPRNIAGAPSQTYVALGIPFVEDFEDVCRQADVFVADNTSCLPEFASTGRPVVLLNSKRWSRKVSHGGRFWDWAHLGINVDRPEDLIPAIEWALEDRPEQQAAREDALGLVYGTRHGGAQVAAQAILEWLAAREKVAA